MSCYEGNTLLDRILRTGHNFVDFFNIEVVLEISKWGSGKSTITENLRNSLVNKDVPVIIFDVWKHEGDALRRTWISVQKPIVEEYTEINVSSLRSGIYLILISDGYIIYRSVFSKK